MTEAVRVGIDPGWTNLGLVVLDGNNKILLSETVNCSSYKTTSKAAIAIMDKVCLLEREIGSVAIERYVLYGTGKPVKDAEHIQHMIGALAVIFQLQGVCPILVRAIDWKSSLCKHLFKTRGYKNPSKSFDKKYSFSIAETICGVKPETDHEADAVGLAYFSANTTRDTTTHAIDTTE